MRNQRPQSVVKRTISMLFASAVALKLTGCLTPAGSVKQDPFNAQGNAYAKSFGESKSVTKTVSVQGVADDITFDETVFVYSLEYDAETDSDTRVGLRNKIMVKGIHAMDVGFTQYESSVFRNKSRADFAKDITVSTLGAAVSFVDGPDGKNALGSLSALITGGYASYEKEFFAEQQAAAFFKVLRAGRELEKQKLYQKMLLSDEEYPLSLAILDLRRLYEAGLPISAFMKIDKTVQDIQQEIKMIEDDVLDTMEERTKEGRARDGAAIPAVLVKPDYQELELPGQNATQPQ